MHKSIGILALLLSSLWIPAAVARDRDDYYRGRDRHAEHEYQEHLRNQYRYYYYNQPYGYYSSPYGYYSDPYGYGSYYSQPYYSEPYYSAPYSNSYRYKHHRRHHHDRDWDDWNR